MFRMVMQYAGEEISSRKKDQLHSEETLMSYHGRMKINIINHFFKYSGKCLESIELLKFFKTFKICALTICNYLPAGWSYRVQVLLYLLYTVPNKEESCWQTITSAHLQKLFIANNVGFMFLHTRLPVCAFVVSTCCCRCFFFQLSTTACFFSRGGTHC